MCRPIRTWIGPAASVSVIAAAAAKRSRRRGEGEEERVALRVHLDPVVRGARFADHASVLGERLGVRLGAKLVQQLRRALDVREEESDRAARQVAAHVQRVSAGDESQRKNWPIAITRDEDEPDDEHREHDVLAFLGDVGGEQRGELEHRRRTLTHAAAMRRQRAVHRVVAHLGPGELRAEAPSRRVAASASRAASSPFAPASAAVAAQAAPSPFAPSARSCAQIEISAARSATAATSCSSATRTRPCAYR